MSNRLIALGAVVLVLLFGIFSSFFIVVFMFLFLFLILIFS